MKLDQVRFGTPEMSSWENMFAAEIYAESAT